MMDKGFRFPLFYPIAVFYINYAGRGDVVQLTTSWGVVTISYDYDPFGNLIDVYLDDTNQFRYCSEYWDDETRNYYLRARYYSPQTGRFTQRDVYRGEIRSPSSLNLYTYCLSNPVIYHDPTGNTSTLNMLLGIVVGATAPSG